MSLNETKKMDDLRPLREIDFDSNLPLPIIKQWAELVKQHIPIDATEDFHIGAQYALMLVDNMMQKRQIGPIIDQYTWCNLGLAFIYVKQDMYNPFQEWGEVEVKDE